MVQLGRNGPRLLATVNNLPHATQDHHADPLHAPLASSSTRSSMSKLNSTLDEEDINADPLSSSDEAPEPPKQPPIGSGFKQTRQLESGRLRLQKQSSFKNPSPVDSPESIGSKRSNDGDVPNTDPEDMVFSSQTSPKRRKQSTYGRANNIHTSQAVKAQKEILHNRRDGIKVPRVGNVKTEVKSAPQFTLPKGHDMFRFGRARTETQWRQSVGTGDASLEDAMLNNGGASPDSSLSSAPSDFDDDEVQALNLPPPKPYVPVTECAICGQAVNQFLREEFEDRSTPGKQLSYKWQQRFCTYHKQHEGKESWKERGYPEIDWSGLEKRMRRHRPHLLAVIDGSKSSYYRVQLSEKLKEGSKTAMQALKSDKDRPTVCVGYYGPRGEKVLTDQIITHLSDDLRKQATKDRLVAAAGVAGGVSGFVQAVLVPELAQRLVMEDMRVGDDRARDVIVESAELGDLLNPEAEEKVTEVVELDD